MAQLDKLILNALDAQRMNEANYSFVMSKLDSYDKKMEFLNFLNKKFLNLAKFPCLTLISSFLHLVNIIPKNNSPIS